MAFWPGSSRQMLVRSTSRATAVASVMARNVSATSALLRLASSKSTCSRRPATAASYSAAVRTWTSATLSVIGTPRNAVLVDLSLQEDVRQREMSADNAHRSGIDGGGDISTHWRMRDVNLELASLLYDMAAIAGDSQRAFGYKRAAKAVLRIDRDITPLVTANTFKAIPGIGPTTDRIARELIVDGRCAFVERAVRESGKEEEITRLHGLRRLYLSRAAVQEILS